MLVKVRALKSPAQEERSRSSSYLFPSPTTPISSKSVPEPLKLVFKYTSIVCITDRTGKLTTMVSTVVFENKIVSFFICIISATLAKGIVKNHAIHAGRQAIEMDNVCQTVRQVDIEPIMSEATMERLKKTTATGIREYFSGKTPDDYMKIIEFLELHLH